MSKQANTTVIGAFVVGAVVLLVAGVLVFGSGRLFSDKAEFVLFFEDSVKGLTVGSPVDFRGVKIGSVVAIKVVLDKKDQSLKIPVYIEIEPNRVALGSIGNDLRTVSREQGLSSITELLIKQGLRAQLEMQSLVTGQLIVHLDFYPDKPVNLVGAEPKYPELPTVRSSLSELSKTVEKLPIGEIANKLMLTIDGLERLVNSSDLKDTMVSIGRTVKSAEEIAKTIEIEVKPIADRLDKTLGEAEKLFRNVDAHVKPIASEATLALKDTRGLINNVNGRVPQLVSTTEDTLIAAGLAMKKAQKAIDGVGGESSGVRFELNKALAELAAAARSIRGLSDYLQNHPEALLQGKKGGKQ